MKSNGFANKCLESFHGTNSHVFQNSTVCDRLAFYCPFYRVLVVLGKSGYYVLFCEEVGGMKRFQSNRNGSRYKASFGYWIA